MSAYAGCNPAFAMTLADVPPLLLKVTPEPFLF
jgi:hypothetical protein